LLPPFVATVSSSDFSRFDLVYSPPLETFQRRRPAEVGL
jgi:hypothetical protein